MNAKWVCMVAASSAIALSARGQANLVISSFQDGGVITWTNPAPNSICRVEWSTNAGGSWSQNWNVNNPIPTATNVTLRAAVPLYYRVVCNLPPNSFNIDFARLQFPPFGLVSVNQGFDVYARLYIAGLTDQSDGVNTAPSVQAQIGYGPTDSDPVTNALWTWTPAAPTPGFSGSGAGEPNNDEYTAQISISLEGSYDYAARFSGDSGANWTYADLEEGTANGYQTAKAGKLTVTPPTPP